jgi:putative FmdB family regulatory protein
MPLYTFICRDCEGRFDDLLASAEHPNPTCPSCLSRKVSRQFPAPRVKFDYPLLSKSVIEDRSANEWGDK